VTVGKKINVKRAAGYGRCYEQRVPAWQKKTLAVGSYGWAVRGEGGQWQFLKLKFDEFFRVGPEALGMMIGVGAMVIRGNGNMVVGESKAV